MSGVVAPGESRSLLGSVTVTKLNTGTIDEIVLITGAALTVLLASPKPVADLGGESKRLVSGGDCGWEEQMLMHPRRRRNEKNYLST